MPYSSTLRLTQILILLTVSGLACAQDIRQERVRFAAGETGATIEGRIKGYESIDYVIGASEGQRISIAFETSNASGYFNLLPPDIETAIHVGSINGNDYDGVLPGSGDYRIRVYLMRNAARRNEVADYVLDVEISPGGSNAGGDPDFADGLAGGPD